MKVTGDFHFIFNHLDLEADFANMEGGYLQLILTLANVILKDQTVNLSVKEAALNVT